MEVCGCKLPKCSLAMQFVAIGKHFWHEVYLVTDPGGDDSRLGLGLGQELRLGPRLRQLRLVCCTLRTRGFLRTEKPSHNSLIQVQYTM